MQFITGSHTEGYFDHVQSKMEGNILNENQDMIILEKWLNKIIQTKLSPGQCTIHDGNSFSIHIQNATSCFHGKTTPYLFSRNVSSWIKSHIR